MTIPISDLLGFIATVGGLLLAFHGGRLLNKAQARNLDIKSLSELSQQVHDLIKSQGDLIKRVDEYEAAIAEKEAELEQKNNDIAQLRLEVKQLKIAFRNVLKWLEDNGIALPEDKKPPDSLLDTDPHMQPARAKK